MEKSYTYYRTDPANAAYPASLESSTLWRHSETGWERLGGLAWRAENPDLTPLEMDLNDARRWLYELRQARLIAWGPSTELVATLDEERGGLRPVPSQADVAKQRELEGLLIGVGAGIAAIGTIVAVGLRQRAGHRVAA